MIAPRPLPRWWRPLSLRALTVAFLALFLATTIAAGVITYASARAAVVQLVDRRIATISDALDDEVAPGDTATILARIDRLSRERDTGDVGLELKDAAGRRLGGNIVLGRMLPPGYSTVRHVDRIAGLSEGRALVRNLGGGLWLTTVVETEPIDDFAALRLRSYLLGFGAIVLVVLGGTALFAFLIGRRIGQLRATAEAIIDGDMRARLPVPASGGAFAAEAATFNRMLDRIAQLMDGIVGVGNDIAHDLRMPLARLRSQLALVAGRAPTPALRDDLDAALAQCDDLLALFAATLRITEVEAGRRRAAFAPVDLGALAAEIGETVAEVARDSDHRLTCATASPLRIVGDRQLLAQALLNLLDNAIRHTPAGTPVTLSVQRVGATAQIVVADRGPGIPAAERATALRRFGRLDPSRHTPGHGLGLPLVDAIARLHRGTLVLDDAAPGLRVTLTLPVNA